LRELRRLWLDLDNADYIRETLKIPDCQIVVRVDRQLTTDDGIVVSEAKRYFITSLDPDHVTALDILGHVRNHWRIENSLHFCKDRWWDEDRHYTRRPGLSKMMAAINNAAISILRILSDKTQPLRAEADYIQWAPAKGLKMMAK